MVLTFFSAQRWCVVILSLLLPLWVGATGLTPDKGTDTNRPVVTQVADADGDGVTDDADRCPNTPAGTVVNAYGCPATLATCDYSTTSFSLISAGGAGGGMVQYVLADSVGIIKQVNNTPAFSGLTGSHTYMALAISYSGPVTGLTLGQPLSGVSAGCYAWSDAQVVKVCVPTSPCDYTLGTTVTLQATGGSTGPGTLTRYVLVDLGGTIVQVTSSPSFLTAGLAAGTYAAYGVVYADDQSLTNLQAGRIWATVQASCIALSAPLTFSLCSVCQPACIPITVRVIHRGR